MSTSLLDHAFGIRGSRYVRTEDRDGRVVFTIRQEPDPCRCSSWGSRQVVSRGRVERRFRSLPLGGRATAVVRPIPRVAGRAGGAVRQAEVPGADPRRSYTRAFERSAGERSRRMTLGDVAGHLDVSWEGSQGIQDRDLSRRFAQPKLKPLRRIALDAIAAAQGHRSRTGVRDRDSAAGVGVGDGRGADALKPFWERLRPSKAAIAAVARARAAAYRSAVSAHRPGAKIGSDHSHGIKLFHEKLSDLGRAVHRAATDVMPQEGLKGRGGDC